MDHMHALLHAVSGFFSLLNGFAETLSAQFTRLACGASSLGGFSLAACVVTSLVLALGCGCWVVVAGRYAAARNDRLTEKLRETQSAVRLRDALIRSLPEAVLVLSQGSRPLLSYRGGSRLLEHCLAGPDAKVLAAAIDSLLTRGLAFSLTIRTIAIRVISVRGRETGGGRALFFTVHDDAEDDVVNAVSGSATAIEVGSAGAAPIRPEYVRHEALPTVAGSEGPDDGMVIIGADGRLCQHNAAFAAQWSFDKGELEGSPHLNRLAALCVARKGHDATWEVVASAVASDRPEQHNAWGVLPCTGGRVLAISASRRTDGSTMIKFHEANASPLARAA